MYEKKSSKVDGKKMFNEVEKFENLFFAIRIFWEKNENILVNTLHHSA